MSERKPSLGPPWAVAAALRAWVEAAGITQVEVADQLQVSQPRVSRVLAGGFTDRSGVARRMCELAGLTLPVAAERSDDADAFLGALRAEWGRDLPSPARLAALLRAAVDVNVP